MIRSMSRLGSLTGSSVVEPSLLRDRRKGLWRCLRNDRPCSLPGYALLICFLIMRDLPKYLSRQSLASSSCIWESQTLPVPFPAVSFPSIVPIFPLPSLCRRTFFTHRGDNNVQRHQKRDEASFVPFAAPYGLVEAGGFRAQVFPEDATERLPHCFTRMLPLLTNLIERKGMKNSIPRMLGLEMVDLSFNRCRQME